jgi:hypothetical protein
MGLDVVEIFIELEIQFQLAIPDAEASKLLTVGQTADYVIERLRERAGPAGAGCASARFFYRLRRELMRHYSIPSGDVRPTSRVGDLVRPKADRALWPEVATLSGLAAPKWSIAHPFSPRFPPPTTTLREIVERAFDPQFHRPDGSVDEEQVWYLVARVVGRQAGIRPEKIRPESRWVEDLWLD